MPWVSRQRQQLAQRRGHAWLLQGPPGLGQYELALELAASWLCEADPHQPCGHCDSCHGIRVHTHADLIVLMPEGTLMERGWPLDPKAQQEIDDKERKPSREIRIEAVRQSIEFAQRTSARGRSKVVLVYPAERMNTIAANALLKTLEEPPGETRFILATEAPHLLLPTLRSRCMAYPMDWPTADEVLPWLLARGLPQGDAIALLRASGGLPGAAVDLAALGCNAARWQRLPTALARGDVAPLADWPAARALEALQKVCHDLMALRAGATPRFFEAQDLPQPPDMSALQRWSCELRDAARSVEHPVQPGLRLEAWVSAARQLLSPTAA